MNIKVFVAVLILLARPTSLLKNNTIWCDDKKNPSSSKFSTVPLTAFFYSFYHEVYFFLLVFYFQTPFYEKIQKNQKFLLQCSVGRFDFKLVSHFDSKLLVFWTINFNKCSDFKLHSRFDFNLPGLWTIHFDSRFDYKFGHLSTFLFAVSLFHSSPYTRPWVKIILVLRQLSLLIILSTHLSFCLNFFPAIVNLISILSLEKFHNSLPEKNHFPPENSITNPSVHFHYSSFCIRWNFISCNFHCYSLFILILSSEFFFWPKSTIATVSSFPL